MIDDIFDSLEDDTEDANDGDGVNPATSGDDVDWLVDNAFQMAELTQSVHSLQTGGASPVELMRFLAMIDNSYLTEPESRSATIEAYYVDRVLDLFV